MKSPRDHDLEGVLSRFVNRPRQGRLSRSKVQLKAKKSRRSPRLTFSSLNFGPESTGIGPYSTDFVRWLDERSRYEVTVLAAHPHYPQWQVQDGYGAWRATTREYGATVHRLRHYVPANPSNVRRFVAELSFASRVFGSGWGSPDVVLTVSPSLVASAFTVLRARLLRIPSVVWVQDLYSVGLQERAGFVGTIFSRALRLLESATLRNATAVVVIHDRFRDRIVDDLKVEVDKVTVIRNWTHLPKFGDIDRAKAREEFGWGSEFVILHTGAQGHKQGLDKLVELADSCSQDLPGVRWILIGDGSQRQVLESLTERMDSVDMWRHLDSTKYRKVLRGADAFLVSEALGVGESAVPSKLTTYFSAGVPVLGLLNPDSISWEEISSARAGIPFTHNRDQLKTAVLSIRNDISLATILGRNGLEYCIRNMDREACCSELEQVLSLLVCKGSGLDQPAE